MADLAADTTLASELAFGTFIGAVGLVVAVMENQRKVHGRLVWNYSPRFATVVAFARVGATLSAVTGL